MDGESAASGSHGGKGEVAESSPNIGSVSVKPPAFEEQSVSKWFMILESMFFTARISVSATKFHHTLSHLPLSVVTRLDDGLIEQKDYDQLKKTLIGLFSKSTPELFEELIDKTKISFSKPTVYLHEIRKLGKQLGLSDDFLKIKFLKALPDTIRPIIVAKENISLDEMAQAADCIMEYEAGKGSSVFSVGALSRTDYGNASNGSSSDPRQSRDYDNHNQPRYNSYSHNRGSSNAVKPRDYSSHSSRNNYGNHSIQSRSYSNVRVNYFSDDIPPNVRSFHENQRPRVCRSHIYFGDYAKNCKPWCILKSNDLPMQPNSRNASRSSSPVGRQGN